MTKSKNSIYKVCIVVIYLFLMPSCKQKEERTFFTKMKSKYKNFKIDSSRFFLKDFGIRNRPININHKDYWEITSDSNSIFGINGYLRYSNNCIYIVVRDAYGKIMEEQKLFDFDTSDYYFFEWKIGKNRILGDSIVLQKVSKGSKDTNIYVYRWYEYERYKLRGNKYYFDRCFEVKISKYIGILSITSLFNGCNDTLEYLILYPREELKIKNTNVLLL